VLEVCRERPYFGEGALKEVRKFLEDPVSWSQAHGGVGSAEEAKPKDAAE
jgi:orotate phosphoribosyltransferase